MDEEIKGDQTAPTYQQMMVWERLRNSMKEVSEINAKIAGRATVILGGSGTAFAAATFATVVPEPDQTVTIILSIIAFLTLLSLGMAGSIWQPSDSLLPGPRDINVLYDDYINATVDDAYGKALIDLIAVLDCERERNSEISFLLTGMIRIFQIQLCLLGTAISYHVFSS